MVMNVDWRESLTYTDEDLERAVRFGWIKRRPFKGGHKVTTKGTIHTREQIRGHDDFRALITPLADLDAAGRLSPSEKHESQIAIAVCACRLNEEQYHEAREALIEYGVDPETLIVDGGLLRDEDWRPLDGEMCRAHSFTPLAGTIEGTQVKSSSLSDPYASIEIETPLLAEQTTGFITHKLDFQHLWEAFNDRGVADDEEVIVIWAKSNLQGMARRMSRTMPGLVVWICPKGTFEITNDPNHGGLEGTAWFEAVKPIAKWEPDVLMR